jgi:hypothetical protein
MLRELVNQQEKIHKSTGIGRVSESWNIEVGGESCIDIRSPFSLLNFIEKELKPEVGDLEVKITRISTNEMEVF